MLKRTIFIESPSHIQIENELFKITNKNTSISDSLSLEDIGFIILENFQTTATIQFFQKAAENNTIVVVCDKSHTPISYTIPLYSNTTQTQTINNQLTLNNEDKQKIWKQLIQLKVKNQASLFKIRNQNNNLLERLSNIITASTANKVESTAARYYWKSLFSIPCFQRDPDGEPPNNLLNYGYAILRAATVRALISSGLLPQIGIQHHNKYNPLPLADDVMEPFRPFVDQIICEIVDDDDYLILHKKNKEKLLKLLTMDTKVANVKRPLMIALSYTTASIANFINKKNKSIVLPEFVD